MFDNMFLLLQVLSWMYRFCFSRMWGIVFWHRNHESIFFVYNLYNNAILQWLRNGKIVTVIKLIIFQYIQSVVFISHFTHKNFHCQITAYITLNNNTSWSVLYVLFMEHVHLSIFLYVSCWFIFFLLLIILILNSHIVKITNWLKHSLLFCI